MSDENVDRKGERRVMSDENVDRQGQRKIPTLEEIDEETLVQIQTEIEKGGLGGFHKYLLKVETAAKEVATDFPTRNQIEGMKPLARRYFFRLYNLVQEATNATHWNIPRLARFSTEVRWYIHVLDIQNAHLDNTGTPPQKGCVKACYDQYYACVEENHCETVFGVCLCCIGCSLELAGCIAKCTIGETGGTGIFIY
jgi:hypothetical protein